MNSQPQSICYKSVLHHQNPLKMCNNVIPREWYKKYEPINVKFRENPYKFNLLFADDRVVITTWIEDTNYMGRWLEEEYWKWGWELWLNELLSTDPS